MNEVRQERLRKKYASKEHADLTAKSGAATGPGPGPRPGPGPGRPGAMSVSKPKDIRKTLGRLMSYLSTEIWKLVLVFCFVIITTISSLAGSYMLRPVINNLVNGSGIAVLVQGIAAMACMYGVGILSQYLQQRIMIGVSQKALQQLRNDLFVKIQKLPVSFYDTNNHGDIMSRFTNDVDVVGEMMNNTVIQIISGGITITGTFLLMIYTNIWLTLLTVVMIPVMIFAGQTIAKKSRRYYKAQQSSIGTLNGFIEEIVTGQKVVKVFNHEEAAEEEFEYLNHTLRDRQIKAQFFGGIMGPVMGNIGQISYSLIACIGGIFCVTRGFDIGGLTVFANYSRQFSRPINELSMQVNTVFSALAGAERVFNVMDQEPEQTDDAGACHIEKLEGREYYIPSNAAANRTQTNPIQTNATQTNATQTNTIQTNPTQTNATQTNPAQTNPTQTNTTQTNTTQASLNQIEKDKMIEVKGAVTLSNVTFGYNSDKAILKNVSFYAKPGQKIALVGSTGAGKTTITNLINRFYDINEGCITIDGINIRDICRDDLRRSVAMVLQDTHLFTGTVRDNIRYGRLNATDEEVEQAAKTASAHSFIMRLEHGYDTMIEGDGANLSQGQRQLLNIARAAVSRAPILILDEATSSVDTRTEKLIEYGMDRLMAERTTLVIAHRLSTVRRANAIMVLENGEIIERGDHDELLKLQGRYHRLYTGLAQLE